MSGQGISRGCVHLCMLYVVGYICHVSMCVRCVVGYFYATYMYMMCCISVLYLHDVCVCWWWCVSMVCVC